MNTAQWDERVDAYGFGEVLHDDKQSGLYVLTGGENEPTALSVQKTGSEMTKNNIIYIKKPPQKSCFEAAHTVERTNGL